MPEGEGSSTLELIKEIGFAERVSVSALLVIKGVLPNGAEVQLFFARKRGFGENNAAPFSHLGGAAKFSSLEEAKGLLQSLPEGGVNHKDGFELDNIGKTKKAWINGYELENGDDARVRGFKDPKDQAFYENKVGEYVNYSATIISEIIEELRDEINNLRTKAEQMFGENTPMPSSWNQKPQVLLDALLGLNYDESILIPASRNRLSLRSGQPQLTHTIIIYQTVKLESWVLQSLLLSGHLTLLDENTRKVNTPIIAIPVEYLNQLKETARRKIAKEQYVEDIPVGVKFGEKGEVMISSQILEI